MIDELLKSGTSINEIKKVTRELICEKKNNGLYQVDPMLWYSEKFGGDPKDMVWSDFHGYDDHQWDGDLDPFKKMFESLADWKNVGIESATSTGKTYMLPRIAYWFLDVFPNSLVVSRLKRRKRF